MPKSKLQPKKVAQPKLSKQQIASQMVMQQEAEGFKKLIREELYPILQRLDSMARAQSVAEILKSVMTAKMNDYWSKKTVADLELVAQLDEEGEFKDADVFKDLLTAMADMPIGDAHKLLQGMGGAFDGYARKLASGQKMAELPVDQIIN